MTGGRRAVPGPGRAGPLRTVSLRLRATVAVIIVVLVVLAGLGIVVDRTFAVQAERTANNLLVGRLQLARQLVRAGVGPQQVIRRVDARGVRASLELTDGRTFGTPPPSDQQTMISRTTLAGNGRLKGAELTLAVDTSLLDEARAALRRSLVITGLAALLLSAVLVTIVMRLSLRPLDAFATLARDVINGRRGQRLRPNRPETELGQAATAVDSMLDELEGAEQHARRAEAEARRAADRSQEFLSDAAHELRTPIAGVQAAAETLLHQGSLSTEAEREQLLVLLVREAQRAGTLSADLLTAARLDTGVEVDALSFDLAELLDSESERTALLHPELTITVQGPSTMINSDPDKIRSIVGNLLGNAVRASGPDGSIQITSTRIRRSDRDVSQVMITDSGPGVAREDRERIFERLVRLDHSRFRPPMAGDRSGGSGLGLAIARGYARALGGELSCVEPPDGVRGAAFVLSLPASPAGSTG